MWKLAVDDDEKNRTIVKLIRDEYSVGRAEENTIRLTERNISRRHARLERREDGWVVRDLESYNGCFLNGMRVDGRQAVQHGDVLELGDYQLILTDAALEIEDSDDDGPVSATPVKTRGRALLEQPDRLVVLQGPNQGAHYPLHEGRLLMGRGDECDIELPDTSVSRVHAEIIGTKDGYEIIDYDSSNGLRINGLELKRAFLLPSDVVELGDVLLKYVPQGEIHRVTPYATGLEAAAPLSDPAEQRGSKAAMWALAAAAVLLVALGISVYKGVAEPESKAILEAPKVETTDEATLKTALGLFEAGNVTEAHEKANELPADSRLRKNPKFLELEDRWAETLLDTADVMEDRQAKRNILSEIASATGVRTKHRKRAQEGLAALDEKGLDLAELPEEENRRPRPAAAPQRKPDETSEKDEAIIRSAPF
jgi:pSer/pThr/pTyr-binding forkhead associated (FHA) protein